MERYITSVGCFWKKTFMIQCLGGRKLLSSRTVAENHSVKTYWQKHQHSWSESINKTRTIQLDYFIRNFRCFRYVNQPTATAKYFPIHISRSLTLTFTMKYIYYRLLCKLVNLVGVKVSLLMQLTSNVRNWVWYPLIAQDHRRGNLLHNKHLT